MALNIEGVLEILQDRRENYSGDAKQFITEWVEAKGIDHDSLDDTMEAVCRGALEQIMGKLSLGCGPKDIQQIVMNCIGTGIELGYTACEIQLEKKFTDPT